MTITARFRNLTDGINRALGRGVSTKGPDADRADGHAPGHRHLGPPPQSDTPSDPDAEPAKNQPWVRTSHSDSQTRRFRR